MFSSAQVAPLEWIEDLWKTTTADVRCSLLGLKVLCMGNCMLHLFHKQNKNEWCFDQFQFIVGYILNLQIFLLPSQSLKNKIKTKTNFGYAISMPEIRFCFIQSAFFVKNDFSRLSDLHIEIVNIFSKSV